MIKHLLLPCIIYALQGCTVLSPENELRVTEYQGTVESPALGSPVDGQGDAVGCRIVQRGKIEGCLLVETTYCRYASVACP